MKKPRRRRPIFALLFWAVLLVGAAVVARERRLLDLSRFLAFFSRHGDPVLAALGVLPRSAWGAAAPKSAPPAMSRATRITVHHDGAAVFREYDRAATVRKLQAIQRYHQREKGWGDIAYHFVIDRKGRIWEGRPLSQTGAHAGSAAANEGNIGILLLGNFDVQVPSGAQTDSLRRLLEGLCRSRGIPRSRVLGHGDVRRECGLGATNCPGRHLEAWLAGFRKS